jgi:hypothetical protein
MSFNQIMLCLMVVALLLVPLVDGHRINKQFRRRNALTGPFTPRVANFHPRSSASGRPQAPTTNTMSPKNVILSAQQALQQEHTNSVKIAPRSLNQIREKQAS